MYKNGAVSVINNKRMTRDQEMIDIITRDGDVSAEEIGKEMRLPKEQIHTMVSKHNMNAVYDVKNYPHIHKTGTGYSMVPRKEYCIYETKTTMQYASGMMARSIYAFAKTRGVAIEFYTHIQLQYNLTPQKFVNRLTNKNNRQLLAKLSHKNN